MKSEEDRKDELIYSSMRKLARKSEIGKPKFYEKFFCYELQKGMCSHQMVHLRVRESTLHLYRYIQMKLFYTPTLGGKYPTKQVLHVTF